MPRKSAASLSVAPPVNIGALPAPPGDLTEFQAALWHQIVATKPGDWWDASNLPLLRALVKHESAAMVIDQQMDEFEPEWLKTDDGIARYKTLSAIRVLHTERVASLATKMRLTQQSRYGTRQAHTAANRTNGKQSRPWES